MARLGLLLICVIFVVGAKASSLEEEMLVLDEDLKKIGEKREAETITDAKKSELLAELKREVLDTAVQADLESENHDTLKQKDDGFPLDEAKDAAEQTNDDFFKALESKADAVKDDPETKRVLALMADDLLDKEINALSDEVQKRADECVDERSDCEEMKKYCVSHKAKMQKVCRKTCDRTCGNPCKDKIANCAFLAKRGSCQSKRVAKFCPRACGNCKAPAPPKCSKTKLGCCWDKVTPKIDKAGTNCPPCADQYRTACNTFSDDCTQLNMAGDFMLKHCPQTCGLCNKSCKDDTQKAFLCPFWKEQLNWCVDRKDTMFHYCPVTCGMC